MLDYGSRVVADIVDAGRFQYMYDNDGVQLCGSAYLANRCHVTANACSDCKFAGLPGTPPPHGW